MTRNNSEAALKCIRHIILIISYTCISHNMERGDKKDCSFNIRNISLSVCHV